MECSEVTGTGCAALVSPPTVVCEDSGSGAGGDSEETGGRELHGSGCSAQNDGPAEEPGCAVAVGPSWASILLMLLLWARRAGAAIVLAALLMPRIVLADDVNAEQLVPNDGGDALSVHEADLGGRWSVAAAATWSLDVAPVVARFRDDDRILLAGVASETLGASLRVADGPRVGMALRLQQWQYVQQEDGGPGDTVVWATVPLLESRQRGVFGAFTVSAALPTGPSAVFLSDESGVLDGLVSGRWVLNAFAADAQIGARLQRTQVIANLEWGARYRWALALSARPWGVGLVSGELFGSGPFAKVADPEAVTPIEADLTAGACLRVGLCLRLGGGGGLTYGVGSPAYRLIVMLDWRRPPLTDRDGDTIVDLRDRCVEVPEDFDLVQDEDGCPEVDADDDGIPDDRDLCATVPENLNHYFDEDGCPDRVVTVSLTVRAEVDVPVETAIVDGLSSEPVTVFVGEATELRVAAGLHPFSVEAEGYLPWSGTVDAYGAEVNVFADLFAIRRGTVRVRLVDAASAPLAGFVRRGAGEGKPAPLEAVPAAGAELEVTTGKAVWAVYAPGYAARTVEFEVRAKERVEVTVVLAPVDLRVEGDRLTTTRQITFDLDKATLRPDGHPVLDDIAVLLRSRPDIELLRIEGHADETGSSRHNLELSRARAEAVRDELVTLGVERGRLEAIGSGEARESRDTRTVDFTILVWADP